MPDNSTEKKEEVPTKLKEVFAWHERQNSIFKLEVTAEEIQLFNELLNGDSSPAELNAKKTMLLDNEFYEEWENAVGPRKEELDILNTELWRKQAVYQAAYEAKKEKLKQNNI